MAEEIMSTPELALSQSDLRRLEQLANASGRTPRGMLKYVLRDGFVATERAVAAVGAGRNDVANGRTPSKEAVTKQAKELVTQYATKKKAA